MNNSSQSTWRLIRSKPLEGAWNMAVDEAILEAVGQSKVLPTLRFYAWNPPCLSLGYAQPVADVDLNRLQALGWQLVRRPTGGRAILHTDELTYSVIAPLHEPRVAGSVLESYRRLSQALLRALDLLGLPAQAEKNYPARSQAAVNGPVCFEVPSNYEITVAGKKLIGSAQARRLSGILQHGSLPLTGDLTRITQALVFPDENSRETAAARLLDHATTVKIVCGNATPWEEAAQAFQTAFSESLELEFEPGHLTGFELQRAAELVKQKYAHSQWTNRV